ncbi:MAG: hypothetical protein ACR2QJ_03040 [Geminicoccaceae bacterium]
MAEIESFIDIEFALMACSDVKLACCRLCKKPLASDLGECIHCGVCNPIEKEKCSWLQKLLLALLIVGAILASMRYETDRSGLPGCQPEETGRRQRC